MNRRKPLARPRLVQVKVTEREHTRWRMLAAASDLSVSELVREAMRCYALCIPEPPGLPPPEELAP